MRNNVNLPLSATPFTKATHRYWLLLLLLMALIGLGWIVQPFFMPTMHSSDALALQTVTTTEIIDGPIALTMNSSPFYYANEWQIDATGADPHEPADPWHEPAGQFQFTYRGSDLALLLATGNYWGYLYVTVDGAPANSLPNLSGNLSGNHNSAGEAAGYRTFYAPEATENGEPTAQWVPIHHATDPLETHLVKIEVWRSWGQKPIRGVAVDALPIPAWPRWPGAALLVVSSWLLIIALRAAPSSPLGTPWWHQHLRQAARLLLPDWGIAVAPAVAATALLLLTLGTIVVLWPLTLLGLLLLAWAALQRPLFWIAALLLGLPFYFRFTLPLLPGRAIGIIDIGLLGGVIISTAHWILQSSRRDFATKAGTASPFLRNLSGYLLAAIISWALIATTAATHQDVAWREWRTVFLYAGLFSYMLWLLTTGRCATTASRLNDQTVLLGAWLVGSTIIAIVALWQYGSDTLLIQAEGVQRVRAFYGSPNNLALYLERSFAVLLAFALFARANRVRWISLAVATIQGAALFLTFSKGAIFFALPTMLVLLWMGGFLTLRKTGRSRQPLWWLAAIALVAVVTLLPFLATERFQRLFDFEQGTGFVRLQLWRSSWQMALDHPWFGVGPDNFLYAYRSLYLLPAAWQEPNLNHPHNWLLDWWTRLGIPGLLLAISWFGVMLWRQWRALQQGEEGVLALGLLAATAAALAHGLIDASYALPDLILIWVLISYLPFKSGAAQRGNSQ